MAKELTIRDYENALVITAKQEPVSGIFAALVTGGALFAMMFRQWFETPVSVSMIVLIVLIASLAALLVMQQRDSKLQVTNLELKSSERFGDSFRSTRNVSRADVRRLEYQEDTTDPETLHNRDGLYAVLRYHSVCILPYVNEQQAAEVIQRIGEKFPDFQQQWEDQSPFGQHFTSLGLDQPK